MALSDCVVLTATEPTDTSLAITVTLTAIVLSQGGVNVPALQGTWTAPTDTRVIGVQFEYQESGANASRTAVQGVDLLKWVATDGLIAGKVYAVRYRAVGVDNYGSWTAPSNETLSSTLTASDIVNQGDLATIDQVDTPEIVNNAVTNQVSSFTAGSISYGVTEVTIQSATITTTGGRVDISFSFVVPYNGGTNVNTRTHTVRVYRDGTEIYEAIALTRFPYVSGITGGGAPIYGWASMNTVIGLSLNDFPSAASNTYEVTIVVDSGGGTGASGDTANNRTLICTEVKR